MARLIVMEPFWYTDDRPDSRSVITRWIKAASEFIDAHYIDGASPSRPFGCLHTCQSIN